MPRISAGISSCPLTHLYLSDRVTGLLHVKLCSETRLEGILRFFVSNCGWFILTMNWNATFLFAYHMLKTVIVRKSLPGKIGNPNLFKMIYITQKDPKRFPSPWIRCRPSRRPSAASLATTRRCGSAHSPTGVITFVQDCRCVSQWNDVLSTSRILAF